MLKKFCKAGQTRGKPEKNPRRAKAISGFPLIRGFQKPKFLEVFLPLHKNIAHNEIEKLILGTLNNRFNEGPPGRINLRMLLHKLIK
jgi:hypothetical protein